MSSAIIVAQRFPEYDDAPGTRYHFPIQRYLATVRAAQGMVVLVYEPRRGGSARGSHAGGRSAFVAWAVLGRVEPDAHRNDHAYVYFDEYHELPRPVPLGETAVSPKAIQFAVLPVADAIIDDVLERGLAPLLNAGATEDGLTDRTLPSDLITRSVREVVRNVTVREKAFRFKVVEEAYGGRCAFTGLRLTNGFGRAEADAAHIRSVASGGPDVVSNGLALSRTMHWAFDRGLVTVSDAGEIIVVERGFPDDLRRIFRPEMRVLPPARTEQQPHPAFLSWHREHVFKGSVDRRS